jgi:hypothetical protein
VQVGGQPVTGLVAVVGVLAQQLGDHRGQPRRHLGSQVADIGRGLDGVLAQQLSDVGCGEGKLPGQAVEQHDAQRVQVRAAVHDPVEHARLLWGAVGERAGDPTTDDAGGQRR